ncbi:MAG: FtsW/RodA/SpoVE family cell cycle protein [Lachnospiraceae bacterium]
MLRFYRLRDYDFKLIILVVIISIIGILSIGSAKDSVQDKQIFGMAFGLVLMVILSLVDYSFILSFYWIIYVVNIVLLLSVTIFGRVVGGAQRWVTILGIQFQPSETAKILLILFYAQFIMKHKDKLNTFKVLLMSFGLLIFPLYLIYTQPDLSTSIMIVILFCVMIFVGGLSFKIIGTILAIIIPTAILFLSIILQPNQTILQGYQIRRILAWLQPESYADSIAYQQLNSITAIGSGQLWGKGLNNNVLTSVKNGNFISEPQTDFIFAIIGEELGFVGSCSVIILLFLISINCLMIAKKSKDLAGTIIATGVASIVGFQGFINIAVATGLMPTTGIPLPFVSYGVTSLVSLYIAIGIVLNIRLQART